MRMRIGFLGLGTMGEPIANNLRKAGHELTVWNRTPSKASHIVSKGGKLAASPRECAAAKELVFTCLSDDRALDAVLDGPDGALAGLAANSILVDMSTAGTRSATQVAARAARAGASFVACPILGTRHAAEQAQIVLVAGGPAAARERVRPALHAISARLFELDDPTHAALLKLCVNAVGGAMITAFGEALALGTAGGLEVARVVEVLQASHFHSPLFLIKGELVERKDFSPRYAISLAEKDQRLAQDAASEHHLRLAVNEAVRRVFVEAIEGGRGDRDTAAVAEHVLERARR